MTLYPILFGLVTAISIVLAIEILKLDEKKIGALTLVAIAFIYVGLASKTYPEVIYEGIYALAYLLAAYYGLTVDKSLIWLGLLVHGVGDLGHSFISGFEYIPQGYAPFCFVVDSILAIYLYIKLKR